MIVLGLLLVFTLPLGILMKQFVDELDSQIEFAIAERQGLYYNQKLVHLLRALMVHRDLAQRNRPGNDMRFQMVAARITVMAKMEEIADLDLQYGSTLRTTEPWNHMQSDWGLVMKAVDNQNLTREELYLIQSSVIQDVHRQIINIGNTSNLILDPDRSTYHIIDILVNHLPEAISKIGYARDLYVDIAENTLAPSDTPIRAKAELMSLKSIIQEQLDHLRNNRTIIVDSNPNLVLPNSRFLSTEQQIIAFKKYLSPELSATLSDTATKSLVTGIAEDTLNSHFFLYDALIPVSDQLLNNRIIQKTSRKHQVLSFTILALLAIVSIYTALANTWQKRFQADQRLKIQYKTTQIAAEAVDLKIALTEILKAICSNQDWDLGELWLVSTVGLVSTPGKSKNGRGKKPQNAVLVLQQSWHHRPLQNVPDTALREWAQTSESLIVQKNVGLLGRVWHQGNAQWVDLQNTVNSLWGRTNSARSLRLRSGVGIAEDALNSHFFLYDELIPVSDQLLNDGIVQKTSRKHQVLSFTILALLAIVSIYTALANTWQKRFQADQRLKIQYKTTQIAAEAVDLEIALTEILKAICSNQDWDLGELWLVSTDDLVSTPSKSENGKSEKPQDTVLVLQQSWHHRPLQDVPDTSLKEWAQTSENLIVQKNVGLLGRVWHQGNAQWVDLQSTVNSLWGRTSSARSLRLRSGVGIAILHGGEVLGVLSLFSQKFHQWDLETEAVLNTLGCHLGEFIHRLQTAQELMQAKNEAESASR